MNPVHDCPTVSCSGSGSPWCLVDEHCGAHDAKIHRHARSNRPWMYCAAVLTSPLGEYFPLDVSQKLQQPLAGPVPLWRQVTRNASLAYMTRAVRHLFLGSSLCNLGHGCGHTVGCMVERAINYDSTASLPGTCVIIGCMNELSPAYDPQATHSNGCYGGCTAVGALNYDSEAGWWIGGCIWPIWGCTDSLAINYDPLANSDHGFCVMPSPSLPPPAPPAPPLPPPPWPSPVPSPPPPRPAAPTT